MRVAYHENPFISDLARVHDRDYGTGRGLLLRKLVEFELVSDPLFRFAVLFHQSADGGIPETKIKPKFLSDSGGVFLFGCLKLNGTFRAFVSLNSSKPSVLFY